MTIPTLPEIMVAPNGARRTRTDHPALPVSVAETLETAQACFEAGAGGIHAHVRDKDQNHVLDVGLYQELIDEMSRRVPDMMVQITTEAVGIYRAEEQRDLVYQLKPKAISFALKEMLSDENLKEAERFYHWAHAQEISVQHILYAPEEITILEGLIDRKIVPEGLIQALFVLGRYTKGQISQPSDLDGFAARLETSPHSWDWAVCAFGVHEIDCLVAAHTRGGKARIGFENSIWNADGSLAVDNAERIKSLTARLTQQAQT